MTDQNTVSTTPKPSARSARAAALTTPICLVRQEKQQTHSSLPSFFQTNLHYGTPENFGNCVAFVYGPNSTDATLQKAFAEKMVRAYNRDDAFDQLVEALQDTKKQLDKLRLEPPPEAGFWPSWTEEAARAASLLAELALARAGAKS
ncbi:hypothetical protein ACE15N_22065 (plasmid) [Xanthomonas campestris pv. passiflorae]